MTQVTKEGIFVGANKQSFVTDYNESRKTVAFGAANNVALWKPLASDDNGVYSTLKKHSKEVTGVKFVPNSPFLVTVAEDDEINVWEEKGDDYTLKQTLTFHKHSITCLAIVNETIFVTGSADGFIALWLFDGNQYQLGHSFQVSSSFYPLALAIQDISEDNYILAVAGTSSNIFIYTFTLTSLVTDVVQSAILSGHEDWVRCLTFVTDTKYKNYVLASGAQDRYIRLWRLRLNELIDDSDEDELKLILLSNKQYKFNIGSHSRGAINFEALIMGHDDWVTSLQWNPFNRKGTQSKLQLLSSSADTALMIWEMDVESGIWCCINRLGEMSIKGASTATGASGGFWSSLWIIDAATNTHYILASGKTGAIRVYKSTDAEAKSFESVLGVTGAVREITDLSWALNGEYFTATSLDQTARLFAPWTVGRSHTTWHEFSRPQIHGYDMICMDNINASKYVSGGDEKILRVFEITNSISKLLKNLCNIDVVEGNTEELPESASLPVLGLSNKAANEQLEAGEDSQQRQDEEENAVVKEKEDILATLTTPPLEDHLQRYTLFPEIEKLYGHGYEITCCATSPDGTLIASACRSNSAKHAVIRVFNVKKDFQQCKQVLEGHNLTVTSMEFSPDGQYLLVVSRDRQFSLWSINNQDEFELVELNPKAHTRIIWDCSWTPKTEFGNFFVTGSRDKQIKLWSVSFNVKLETSLKLDIPSTSIACYKAESFGNKVVVAVGLENGGIEIYSVDLSQDDKRFQLQVHFNDLITPADRISKLAFSSKISDKLLLAVGSNDTSIRVYSVVKQFL